MRLLSGEGGHRVLLGAKTMEKCGSDWPSHQRCVYTFHIVNYTVVYAEDHTVDHTMSHTEDHTDQVGPLCRQHCGQICGSINGKRLADEEAAAIDPVALIQLARLPQGKHFAPQCSEVH